MENIFSNKLIRRHLISNVIKIMYEAEMDFIQGIEFQMNMLGQPHVRGIGVDEDDYQNLIHIQNIIKEKVNTWSKLK